MLEVIIVDQWGRVVFDARFGNRDITAAQRDAARRALLWCRLNKSKLADGESLHIRAGTTQYRYEDYKRLHYLRRFRGMCQS